MIVLASLPPLEMVGEAVWYGLLLPLLAAGVVLATASRIGHGARNVGTVAAVVAGFVVGNHFRQAAEYRIDADLPFAAGEFASEVFHSVGMVPNDAPTHPPARYWLPWAALLAAGVGLLARVPHVPPFAGRLLRALTSVLVARLLVSPSQRAELPWLWPAFAVVVLAEWELLDTFAEDSGGWLLFGLGIVFLAAGAVLLHSHSGLLTDLATIVAGSCFGVALVAWCMGIGARGAVPIVVVSLPGLMLIGWQSNVSEVPVVSFALVALAPFILAPLLLMRDRFPRVRTVVGLVLLIVTIGVAVLLAAQGEPLSFD